MHARRFKLAEGILAQTTLNEAVLLDARAGSYFGANGSATIILRALVEGKDEAQMLTEMMTNFDAEEAQLASDLRQCLGDWLARGLIVEA